MAVIYIFILNIWDIKIGIISISDWNLIHCMKNVNKKFDSLTEYALTVQFTNLEQNNITATVKASNPTK
jgi:hypothetical protein